MDYLNTLKQDASEKYQQMAEGSFKSPISVIKPADASQFLSKQDAFNKRLETEAYNISSAFTTIKQNRQRRVEQEEQRRKNAEAERQRRLKEEQEERDRKAREIRWKEEARKEKRNKIIIWTVIIALIAGAILAIIIGAKSCNAKKAREELENYGVSNIHISVTSFENSGYSGYYYVSKLKITVKNDCKVGLEYLAGSMRLESSSTHETLWSGTYTLSGNVPSGGGTAKWNVDLKKDENTLSGYTYEGLDIYVKIESARFSDYASRDYGNTEYIKVHEGSKQNNTGTNNSSSGDSGEFHDVLNYELADRTELLKWLHHDVNSNIIVPEQGLTYISYSNNCNCYTADYSEDYTGSGVFFEISDTYKDSLVSSFKQALSDNGWTNIYDSGYYYEYKKNNTHIVFHNVRASEVWTGYSYEIQYYYMNYYAFNVV